jgi:dTDP-4-dehydrorhamnose reductase
MKKVVLTGAGSQLSQELQKIKSNEFEFIALTKEELDLTFPEGTVSLDRFSEISMIINCAAYTKVDMAEREPILNYTTNAIGVRRLAEYSSRHGIKLIHISTDSVFSTEVPFFHEHGDVHTPINAYSKSKSDGEKFLGEYMDSDFWIIRTSWLYGDIAKGFVPTILKKLRSGERFGVVSDQFGQPTWTRDLSDFILKILEESLPSGTYHVCSKDFTSRFGLAQKIAECVGADPYLVSPMETVREIGIAVRPRYSLLSTELESRLSPRNSRGWRSALEEYLAKSKFGPDIF